MVQDFEGEIFYGSSKLIILARVREYENKQSLSRLNENSWYRAGDSNPEPID